VTPVLGRIIGLVSGLFAAIFLVSLAVANRHTVRLVLDPFNPENPAISTELPFYAYMFAMLIAGVMLGGFTTWMSQGKWRRTARNRTYETTRWRAEAERLTREREAAAAADQPRKQLAVAGGTQARLR
jgi:uncharacterized integral membrane protein